MSFRAIALSAVAFSALAAAQAHADGVAWLTVSDQTQFYPQSWPTGQTSYTHTGTGQYAVTFFGLGNGLSSDVQVNALQFPGQGTHYCTSNGWFSSNGTDVTADVSCFGMSGALQDGDFAIFYQTRTGAPASGTVAFLWGNLPTTASYTPSPFYSYNSTGGTNTVTRNGTGNYFAYLPGITKTGGNVQVTAYGGSAARCEVVDWYHNFSGTNVSVLCVNASGTPTDGEFDLSFTENATEAVGTNTSLGGYVWANQPTLGGSYTPVHPYNYNNVSTKKLTVQNTGGGQSFLNMSVPQGTLFSSILGMVTAYGSAGEFCGSSELGYFGTAKHETLTLFVDCYDKNGNPLNAYYDGTLITGQ